MRIWSLHPAHLDRAGLVACWRESLLAQAVLAGRTRGYRHHPQLEIASGKSGNGDGFVAIALRQFIDVDDFNIAKQIRVAAVFVKNDGTQTGSMKFLEMLQTQTFIGREQNGLVHFLRAIMAELQNIDVHQQRFAMDS